MIARADLALAALLLAAGPATAQAPEFVRDMAGRYQLLPTDGSPACGIALTAERAGAAWRARPEPSCAARVPASARVVAWRPLDGIVLLDSRGAPAMTFVEDETALPSSPDLQAPKFYLVPRLAGYTHVPQPPELVGRWTLKRRHGAICTVTLFATPAYSSAPRHGVALGRDCTAKSTPGRLTRWRIEGLKIMLEGPNDALLALEPLSDRRYVGEPGAWELAR